MSPDDLRIRIEREFKEGVRRLWIDLKRPDLTGVIRNIMSAYTRGFFDNVILLCQELGVDHKEIVVNIEITTAFLKGDSDASQENADRQKI